MKLKLIKYKTIKKINLYREKNTKNPCKIIKPKKILLIPKQTSILRINHEYWVRVKESNKDFIIKINDFTNGVDKLEEDKDGNEDYNYDKHIYNYFKFNFFKKKSKTVKIKKIRGDLSKNCEILKISKG